MLSVPKPLASLAGALPAMLQSRKATLVKRRRATCAVTRIQHPTMDQQERNKRDDGREQPRCALAAEDDNEGYGRQKNGQPCPCECRVTSLETCRFRTSRRQPGSILRYGRIFPSVFHK